MEARYEGIAGKTLITTANRAMINHFASRVDAANPGAWINAFTVLAGTIYGTVGADSALRATIRRSSDKCG